MEHPASLDDFKVYQAHSEEALNYVQTPRKQKVKGEYLMDEDDSIESQSRKSTRSWKEIL